MLVLSRNVGEKIVAGDVIIEVCEIRPGKVRLGITADRGTIIDREEVHQRKGGGPLNSSYLPRKTD